jgi:opacity protein-like surface antigen
MKRGACVAAICLAISWSAAAQTSVAPAPATAASDRAFVLGVQLGMGFPQPFSALRNFGVYALEGGYALRPWGRRFQLGAMFSFSEPGAGGGTPDPRLTAGGGYRFNFTQREYVLELGFLLRAFPLGARVNAYGRGGFRVYLLDSVVNADSAGSVFGQYNETFTEPGLTLGGGLEVRLGPGAFNAELRVDFSNMNRRLSGDSNTGMLTLAVGYRFFL